MRAGPFSDLTGVSQMIDALKQLPSKPRATISGFEDDQVLIQLDSAGDEPIVIDEGDVARLPFRSSVTGATPTSLTLRFSEPPARGAAADGPAVPLHTAA